MILGIPIKLSEESSARDLMSRLKKVKVSVQLQLSSETTSRFFIEGKYDDLISFLNKRKSEIIQDDEDIRSEEENSENPMDLEEPEEIDFDDEELEEIQTIIDRLNETRNNYLEVTEGKEVGDILYTKPDFSETLDEAEMIEALKMLAKFSLLIKHNLIESKDKTMILKEKVPVDDLIFSSVIFELSQPEADELIDNNLNLTNNIVGYVGYTVLCGPEILFLSDDTLKSIIMDSDIPEEDIYSIFISIQEKMGIVVYILDLIKQNPDIDLRTLYEMEDPSYNSFSQEKRDRQTFEITPDYMKLAVEDLKKLGVIRIKGNRVRLSK